MLQNDFYHIRELKKEEGKIEAQLELNPGHRIFEGHFPGQPVVPGVCMVQMIKEVLETVTNRKLQLKTADHIKFLSVIDPLMHTVLHSGISYKFTEKTIDVNATLWKEEVVTLKLKGSFVILH